MIEHKNLQDIKIVNRAKVLRLIFEQPGLTRKMIANKTQLSNMSVANIIGEYIDHGLVYESVHLHGATALNAGRPSHRIDIRENALYIIGIYISEMEITCSILNFRCEIVVSNTIVPSTAESNEELLAEIDGLLDRTVRQIPIAREQLLGVGIASVGLIDYEKGSILRADNYPNIISLPLVEYYSARFDAPVLLSNDMDASAIAEKYFGGGIGVSNFIYLGVNSCIGTGMYINDRIYRGHNGLAGELGYTSIDTKTPRMPKEQQDQLESCVRIDRYVAQANRDLAANAPDMPPFAKSHLITWTDIVNEADKGNAYCTRVIETIGAYLSVTIVNLINLLDPEMIVIGGQIAAAGEILLRYIHEAIRGKSIKRLLSGLDNAGQYTETKIVLSRFGDQTALVGSGAVLFDALFQGDLSVL